MEPTAMLLCMDCLRDAKVRRAWSVSQGDALCVRHAVARLGLDDDMEEHEIYEDAYEELRRLGHPNTY